MAVFTSKEFSYSRIDCHALVYGGIVTVEEKSREKCHTWLRKHGYTHYSLDCARSLVEVAADLGKRLQWEENFGYAYETRGMNLDALNDGFDFDVPDEGGLVFELVRPDLLWEQSPQWLLALLDIAQEHTRYHMLMGRRFFTMLTLPDQFPKESKISPFIGQVISTQQVPWPFRER